MSRCDIFGTGTRIGLYLVLIVIYHCKKMIFVGIGLKFGGFFFSVGCQRILRVPVLCSFRLKNRRFKSELNLSDIEDHDDNRKIERELSQQIEDAMLEEEAETTGKPSLV